MRYNQIPNTLFKKNRSKLSGLFQPNAMAIVHSNDQMPRNGDLFYPYRQSSDFFYLTGIDQEKSVLILYPDCTENNYKEALFIIRPNEDMEIWEGKKLSKTEAAEISGIDNVFYIDEYASVLKHLSVHADSICLNDNENDRFQSDIRTRDYRIGKEFQQQNSLFTFKRLAPLLEKIRVIKEPEEISLMKHACGITREAFFDVLRNTKAGMAEYEIEAILSYNFTKLGASGHAYEPIVASGINSCYLHYTKNNRILQNGDILFMDFGAEYANYSSDCSRAIPVSGRFSLRQREVYNSVLKIMFEARQMLCPGTTVKEVQKEVCKLMEKELLQLKLLTQSDIDNQDSANPAYRRYFMHGISHFMGLDTHDVGSKDMKLQPGMVFSCEPGIYIPEENLGIRLENDILVADGSPIDLMGDIPVMPDEIEELMNQ